MSNNKDICCICLGDITENKYILEPCKHVFHVNCIIDCLRKCGPKCPYCRGLDSEFSEKEDFIPYYEESIEPDDNDDALVRVSAYGNDFETVLSRGDIADPGISLEEVEELFNSEISDIPMSDSSMNNHIIDLSFNLEQE